MLRLWSNVSQLSLLVSGARGGRVTVGLAQAPCFTLLFPAQHFTSDPPIREHLIISLEEAEAGGGGMPGVK